MSVYVFSSLSPGLDFLFWSNCSQYKFQLARILGCKRRIQIYWEFWEEQPLLRYNSSVTNEATVLEAESYSALLWPVLHVKCKCFAKSPWCHCQLHGSQGPATSLACSQSFPRAIPFNKCLFALVKWNPSGFHGYNHFSDGFVSTGYAELYFHLSFMFTFWVSHTDILVEDLNGKNESLATFKSRIHIVSHPLAHPGWLDLSSTSSAPRRDVFSSMTEDPSLSCRIPMPSRLSENDTNFRSSCQLVLSLLYFIHVFFPQWVILGTSNSSTKWN